MLSATPEMLDLLLFRKVIFVNEVAYLPFDIWVSSYFLSES